MLCTGFRLKLETTMAVIVACAVLHNIAIEQNEDLPDIHPDLAFVNFDEDIPPEGQGLHDIHTARDELLNNYFRRLAEH